MYEVLFVLGTKTTTNSSAKCCDHGVPLGHSDWKESGFLVESGIFILVGNHFCSDCQQLTGFDIILQCDKVKYYFLLFVVLGIEPRTSLIHSKYSITRLHPWPMSTLDLTKKAK